MEGQSKLLLNLCQKIGRRNRFVPFQALLDKRQYVRGKLRCSFGSRLLGKQSRGPFVEKLFLQLVECLPTDAKTLTNRTDTFSIHQMGAKHFVPDLKIILVTLPRF